MHAAAARLPRTPQLAALGVVVCLHRTRAGGELGGWSRARRAAWDCSVDSDGVREMLVFFDDAGQRCWQLGLLPETDFLAWEDLTRRVPPLLTAHDSGSLAERLWRRTLGRLSGEAWQASVVRLHAIGPIGLAVSRARPSPLGRGIAERHARDAGAELSGDVVAGRLPGPRVAFLPFGTST